MALPVVAARRLLLLPITVVLHHPCGYATPIIILPQPNDNDSDATLRGSVIATKNDKEEFAAQETQTKNSSNVLFVPRDLQETCATTAAYHPDYVHGWSFGKCDLITTCSSPSYSTELVCCLAEFAGQASKYCMSQLESPPTISPSKTSGLDIWIPDYSRQWPEGKCINTNPMPPNGYPTYVSQLACCNAEYIGQTSGTCLKSALSDFNTPIASPGTSFTGGTAGVYYPNYSLPWSNGKCINTAPVPNGRQTYSTQLACCKAAYAGQMSNVCINSLPNAPTTSPTKTGGPDVYYPDYSLPWSHGKCINTVPVPNGRPMFTSQLGCCQSAYRGQTSSVCVIASSPTTAPSLSPSTLSPTHTHTLSPTYVPTFSPTHTPTLSPTDIPTFSPTHTPTLSPTDIPTFSPSQAPTLSPSTHSPTPAPTLAPTPAPSFAPTHAPTSTPSTLLPTRAPTILYCGATLDTWTGIPENAVDKLILGTRNFTISPSVTQRLVSLLEGPTNFGDNYGSRIKGWLVPPISGNYTFWIASKDTSEFWLSTDADPSRRVKIAFLHRWTTPRGWDRWSEQKSVNKLLVAGQAYYYEAFMKESSGLDDNFALAWQYPGQAREVIPAPYSRVTNPNVAGATCT